MALAALAGTATGMFLSAIAQTEGQASTLVPIALIPANSIGERDSPRPAAVTGCNRALWH
jgi:hypothetical protein